MKLHSKKGEVMGFIFAIVLFIALAALGVGLFNLGVFEGEGDVGDGGTRVQV